MMTHDEITATIGTERMPWWPDGVIHELLPTYLRVLVHVGSRVEWMFNNMGPMDGVSMFNSNSPTALGQLELLCRWWHGKLEERKGESR